MNTTNNERVSYLFNRYYEKLCTEAEKKELFLLLNALSDEELSLLTGNAFDNLNKEIIGQNDIKAEEDLSIILKHLPVENITSGKGIIPLWKKLIVAASLLLFVSSVIYFSKTKLEKKSTPGIVQNKNADDASPGSNKAILTLDDGSTIQIDDASNGLIAKQGGIEVKKTSNGQLLYVVKSADPPETKIKTNKISTPRGGQFQVVLPDGSKAWLNAASSISFPTAFTKNKRAVTMTGEVYFEVTKNAAPFIVNSTKGSIQVLGTHFNIMAYDDEKSMETTLLEGSIKLTSGHVARILKPGQQAQSSTIGDIKMPGIVDVDEVIAWKTGLFQFKDADIETVMRQISRWYDVDIAYDGKLPHKEINGKISRHVKASEVLDMLNYTGINFKIEGKNIKVIP